MTKGESKIESFAKSMYGLEEVILAYDKEDNKKTKVFLRDSAIQRFEMCFDLAWKTLKEYLLDKKGVSCFSPKVCFREAFQNNFFHSDDSGWMQMTDDRNLMSHIYDESEAEKVFLKLSGYLILFKELLAEIKKPPEAIKNLK